jgi:hypothetical protein
MTHLTEDILIQYQFNLLSEPKRQAASEHLAGCDECRQALTALQKKFSVLDALDSEADLPQELISKTLTKCTARRAGFGMPVIWKWGGMLSAAAAVLIMIGFLWLQQPDSEEDIEAKGGCVLTESEMQAAKQTQIAKRSATEAETDAVLSAQGPRLRGDDNAVADGSSDRLSRRLRSGLLPEDLVAGDGGVRIVRADEIPDSPPFAPASAIELVVLPRPEAMQVTIYNSADLTLVRDTRKLTLKPGWNWLQFMWTNTKIDPTSLSLRPLEQADKIDIQQLVFPARLKDIVRWLIRSEVEGSVPFEITYFTSGLSWRAVYEGTLSTDESTMDLKGYVRVENQSGQEYVNTQTRLLLGKVRLLDPIATLAGRQYPYGPERAEEKLNCFFDDKDKSTVKKEAETLIGISGLGGDFAGGVSLVYEMKKIEKEGLSEYFLYTIEGTEDLPEAWGKRLESLDVSGIPVKSLYKYDEERYGGYGGQTVRFVSFKNDTEHELGTTPLPEGNIRIFRRLNDAKNLSYVGQSEFKYIPVNEDVELNMGGSERVKVEPKLMDIKTAHHTFDKENNVSGWDEIETWQMKMTNTRDIPAEFEITRGFGTNYWDLETSDVDYKKHDNSHARFTVTLEPRGEKTFTYTVTKYQGQRNEYYVKKEKEQMQ